MKRVLLTGATGFIGRHCLPLLAAGEWEVHGVSTQPPDHTPRLGSNVFWHQVDLLDFQRIPALLSEVKPDHLLHLAWFSTAPGGFWNSPLNLRWVQASLELVQAFEEQGGQRMVLAGTCAEYDWSNLRLGERCQEWETPLRPATIYGTCKHALYSMLEAWSQRTKISTAWGRLFFLYGSHEHPERLVASTIRALLNDAPALCSSGLQIRDFLHVRDAAAAFVALLQSEIEGPVNIASGQAVPVKDVANCIGDLLDKPSSIALGSLPTKADEPPFLVADVGRLSNEVGWRPYYDLQSGLRATIDWWQKSIVDER